MEYNFVYKKFEDKYTKDRGDAFLDSYKKCKKKNRLVILLHCYSDSKKYEEMLRVSPNLYLPFYYENVKVVLI